MKPAESIFADWNGMLSGNEDLEALSLLAADYWPQEFFWSTSFEPAFVAACAAAGFLPMATRTLDEEDRDREIFLPKFHLQRCVVIPGTNPVPRSARRRARGRTFRVNRDFRQVLENCVEAHGDDWLVPELRETLTRLHGLRHDPALPAAFISAEIWEAGDLLAGEIGYACGAVYTSMTGWHSASGTGSLQLHVLDRAFARQGLEVWDLGMDMHYKRDLGAGCLNRKEFRVLRINGQSGRFDWQALEERDLDCMSLLENNL